MITNITPYPNPRSLVGAKPRMGTPYRVSLVDPNDPLQAAALKKVQTARGVSRAYFNVIQGDEAWKVADEIEEAYNGLLTMTIAAE